MEKQEIENINKLVDELLEKGSVLEASQYQDIISIVSDIQEVYRQEENIDLRAEMNAVSKKMKIMGADNIDESLISKLKNLRFISKFNYKTSLAFVMLFAILAIGFVQFRGNQGPVVLEENIPSGVLVSYGGKTNYGQDPYNSYIDVSFSNMSVDDQNDLSRHIKFEPEISYQAYSLGQGESFRIKPTASLEYGREYMVSVSKALKMQDKQKLDENVNFKFSVRPEMEVLCVKPSDKSENVSLDSKIEIELSYMCADVANLNNLILFEPKIEGEFTVDKTKITFTPTKLLEASTTYKIIVKKELKNEFGEGISENLITTFTTANN